MEVYLAVGQDAVSRGRESCHQGQEAAQMYRSSPTIPSAAPAHGSATEQHGAGTHELRVESPPVISRDEVSQNGTKRAKRGLGGQLLLV